MSDLGETAVESPVSVVCVAHKFVPPRGARQLMPRSALLARLLDARRQRCIVIHGPAGSAKTSTLMAWRHSLLTLDFDVAWLSLAPADDEVRIFFAGLLASLALVDRSIVDMAERLTARDGDELAVEHWVIALVRGVARHKRELVLMLDDVHHLRDARIFEALRWLIDYAPPQLHVVLTSRRPLPLSLARLRAQGLTTEFDQQDLRFSAEESERFLREQSGRIGKRDAQVVHELTDGWATGLQSFANDLKARRGAPLAPASVCEGAAFVGYFEREVLARLPRDDVLLLTYAALCGRFCAPLCADLLDQAGVVGVAIDDIAAQLIRLEADNLFVTSVAPEQERDAWYRLHPLLRSVLLNRVASLPDEAQRGLHAAAWHWFDAHGHMDEAVQHAVLAGNSEAAANMVEGFAHTLLARGELRQLASLMRRLPPGQVAARFDLLVMQAYLQMYAGETDALQQGIRQIARRSERSGPRERYALAVLRGGLALQRDDTDSVAALLPELQRVPSDADAFTRAGRSNILSWMFIHRGEYAEARKVLEEGASREGAPRGILLGRCMGGMTHAAEGQVLLAERVLREVLTEADKQGAAYIGISCMSAALLGEALYELNDVEAALALLENRIDLLERVSIPDTVLRALTVLAGAHWLAGRRGEALDYLTRIEDYAARRQVDRLLACALHWRSRWLLDDGQVDEADAALSRLEALAVRYSGAVRSTAWEISVCAGLARIAMCLHQNDFDGAVARLKPLAALSEAGGRWSRVASVRLQLAIAEQGRCNDKRAREHLTEALRVGHRLGLMRSVLDGAGDSQAMLDVVVSDPHFDPVLAFYAERLVNAGKARARVPAGASSPQASGDLLSERESEVLSLLALALPNKKIARVMDVSLDTVKWHLKNIYRKLDVSGRDGAVARMRDLNAG
ncbi:LuxR C-terminal-related transcriptional regulator [Caballeronia sp. GAWG1-1]|uniref:LuxR C-terminal-related transcriptional regulator n=1 Tax=Caballeronia sp. GAWG1-1 TaxID=2921742 RepID=UPI002027D6F8|nr:LuxR C-terminal-related transcriptional regulator [Caballeronia sp. GAWG1-1]